MNSHRQLLAWVTLLSWFGAVPVLAQNLVQNGGFTSNLASWTNPTSGTITTTWEAGQAKAVVGSSGGVALLQGGMALTGGVSYEVGASMRLQPAGGSATVRVNATGDPNGAITAEASTGSTSGASVSAILYNPSASAKTAEVWLMVPNQTSQAVWFDDAFLRALPASAEFTASRTTIAAGESVTLTWATVSAPQVSIDHGIGAKPRSGSVTVTPSGTTTYTLTATGPVGTVTRQVTVTVVPPPTVTFSATPPTIAAGESAVLAWSTTQATSVMILPDLGPGPLTGSVTVSPTSTTTYTVVASGPGGTTTRDATVAVGPPRPAITFTASPRTIGEGEGSTLSRTVLRATNVSINNGLGARPASGSVPVTPPSSTTYRLTATGPGGTESAQVTVTVLAAPVIVFSATPTAVTRGQAATLTWTVEGASLVVIDPGVGAREPSGTAEVRPEATTTYLLTATGPGGTRQAQATVAVNAPGRRRAVRH